MTGRDSLIMIYFIQCDILFALALSLESSLSAFATILATTQHSSLLGYYIPLYDLHYYVTLSLSLFKCVHVCGCNRDKSFFNESRILYTWDI